MYQEMLAAIGSCMDSKELSLEDQRVLLAVLGWSGRFDGPAGGALRVAARVVGDHDDILMEILQGFPAERRPPSVSRYSEFLGDVGGRMDSGDWGAREQRDLLAALASSGKLAEPAATLLRVAAAAVEGSTSPLLQCLGQYLGDRQRRLKEAGSPCEVA